MGSLPKLKINFADFFTGWNRDDSIFMRHLPRRYEVEISDNPDILFYSDFGRDFQKFKCRRIYTTAENLRPDFGECDYAMTFDYLDVPQHLRLPLYLEYADMSRLIKPPLDFEAVKAKQTRFCNFIYSNRSAQKRVDFFHELSKYKKVDSAGKLMNNVGEPVRDKVAFQSQYKFTIAFENSRNPGYTTEKITHPMLAGSIPIYWGNPVVGREFNTKSFLFWDDFQDDQKLIDRIIEIDQNEDLWREILSEPWLPGNQLTNMHTGDEFLDYIATILADGRRPIALDPPSHQASRRRLYWVGTVRKIIGKRKGR